MEDSFLFAGVKFDRKRFANDINRFKPCKLEDEEKKIEELVTAELPKEVIKTKKKSDQQVKLKKALRKRKRNEKSSIIETVDGFNVFKGAKSTSKAGNKLDNSSLDQLKKEERRQIEQNLGIRKKYGIRVSNNNLPAPLQHFAELGSRYGCKPYLLRNFSELGYKEPTPIQRQIIPLLLSGLQCFACAPTGSGKTLAFLCPIIMKIKPGSKDGIKAVILCPTRELAAQTTRECKKLTKGKKFHIRCMTKELSRTGDFKNLNCDIIVSTPVRMEYAMCKRKLDLSRVEFLILDEADKLFELGYIEQIDKITHACSNDSAVRALFSATLPEYVEEFARTKMLDAVRVIVGKKNTAAALIKQKLIYVGSEAGKLIALKQNFAESLNPPILGPVWFRFVLFVLCFQFELRNAKKS